MVLVEMFLPKDILHMLTGFLCKTDYSESRTLQDYS